MTVKAVFRVQCDGPCKGWLSVPEGKAPDGPVPPSELLVVPQPTRTAVWPGERAARYAAGAAGWEVVLGRGRVRMMCPACRLNPLGIRLPPPGLPQ